MFSPNGDGVNDDFYITYLSAKFGQLLIYNRWGDLIKLIEAQQPRWDGTNEANVSVPEGTYFFIANYLDFYSQPVKLKGYITLVK